MADIINVDWMWMGVGFVLGIGCSWAVCDIVFPTLRK